MLNPNFQIEQIEKGEPGRYRVTAQTNEGAEVVEEYNTVSTAIYNLIAAFFFFFKYTSFQMKCKSPRMVCLKYMWQLIGMDVTG